MMKKILLAGAVLAIAGPAFANAPPQPLHKNMCSGIVSGQGGKVVGGAMDMRWNLATIQVEVGDSKIDFKVSNIHGRIGETDMTIDAESDDGSSIHFVMPLDGMDTRRQPDTVHIRFGDHTAFIGVCIPVK